MPKKERHPYWQMLAKKCARLEQDNNALRNRVVGLKHDLKLAKLRLRDERA